jgi:hypothetical protein
MQTSNCMWDLVLILIFPFSCTRNSPVELICKLQNENLCSSEIALQITKWNVPLKLPWKTKRWNNSLKLPSTVYMVKCFTKIASKNLHDKIFHWKCLAKTERWNVPL